MTDWLVRQSGSEPIGPVSTDLVIRGLQAGRVEATAVVCRVGTGDWRLVSEFAEFAQFVFDDAETNVTDSPWFDHNGPPSRAPATQALGAPPTRQSAGVTAPRQGLGLPAPPQAVAARSAPMPPSRPSRGLVAGQRGYDEVDDDAETRVAQPPSEMMPTPPPYAVDDETMTRVAAGNRPAPAPQRAGVLPTVPMPEVPDFQATRADMPQPRPAAGQRDPRNDAMPPTQPFIQVGNFPNPTGPGLPPVMPPHDPNAQYGYGAAPPQFGSGSYPPYTRDYPPQQPPYPADSSEQGLKALVGLIVFLAVALAIVLILLLIRH